MAWNHQTDALVLALVEPIKSHYYVTEQKLFPLEGKRDTVVELFSLVKPIGDIITMAQCTSYPSGIDVYLALCRLKTTILLDDSPLPLFDHARSSTEPLVVRPSSQLTTLTVSTRKGLFEAMKKRFYSGYNGTPRSLVLESQVFLHPLYRNLRCLNSILSSEDANKKREEFYSYIFHLCKKVGVEPVQIYKEERESNPRKLLRLSNAKGTFFDFGGFGESQDAIDDEPKVATPDTIIHDEIKLYLKHEKVKSSDVSSQTLLSWWRKNQSRFPTLSAVARSVLGHPASSTQIERDFGTAGTLLSGKRSRMDSTFVEMSLYLRCNFRLIPTTVQEISVENWKEKIPKRFTGLEDVELLLNFSKTAEDTTAYLLNSDDSDSDEEDSFMS